MKFTDVCAGCGSHRDLQLSRTLVEWSGRDPELFAFSGIAESKVTERVDGFPEDVRLVDEACPFLLVLVLNRV